MTTVEISMVSKLSLYVNTLGGKSILNANNIRNNVIYYFSNKYFITMIW